jgi:hypothetical protein
MLLQTNDSLGFLNKLRGKDVSVEAGIHCVQSKLNGDGFLAQTA